METVKVPAEEVVGWLLENVRVRAGFAELVAGHDPLIVSAGFHELIDPVLAREGISARVVANHVTADPPAGGPFPKRRSMRSVWRGVQAWRRPPGWGRSPSSATAFPTVASRSLRSVCSRVTALPAGSNQRGEPYEPFDDFGDVIASLSGDRRTRSA